MYLPASIFDFRVFFINIFMPLAILKDIFLNIQRPGNSI